MKTFTSFRATTRNPTLKLLSRLFAVFGLVMMFAVSGWAANNPTVSLSCTPNPVLEGSSGNTVVTCVVSLNEAPDGKDIKLTIQTTNGTATTANSDYQALVQNLVFAEDTTTLSQNFTVNIIGDTTVEPNEFFTVSLVNNGTNPSQGFTPPPSPTIITITNDDGSEINVLTVEDGATDTSFGNTLVTGGTIDRTYTIQNSGIGNLTIGIVTATGDFSITAQPSATVAPGDSTSFVVRFNPSAEGVRTGIISFSNNDADENPYNFNVSGVGLVSKSYGLTVDSVVVSENAGTANINIRVDPAVQTGDSLTVNWATSDDTATLAGFDYQASSGTMTITSSSSNFFTVTILDDLIPESQEILNTTISNAVMVSNTSNSTVSIPTPAGTITINDNDIAAGIPTLSIADRTLSENGGNMVFTVTRSATATSDVFFSYATVDGTAWAGEDFTLTSGTGVISAGASSTTISVPILNDIMAGEGSETFNVVLSNPSIGTQLGDSVAIGTIIDDDTGLTLSIGNAQIAETNTNAVAIVRVYFSEPLSSDINITYHTSNGTATEPNDYIALTQNVIVPLGSTFYDINVIIVGDTAQEVTEAFFITLDSTTAGTIAKAQSKVTIFDNDGLGGCSSYVGMITINEYQNNPNYRDDNHPLANNAGMVPGNYIEIKYLDFLVKQYVNNLWTISVVTKTGSVAAKSWGQADSQCPDPRYEIFEMPNNVMTAEGYVVIKDANGNEVDILNISTPNNAAQQCQNFFYDTDFESSAQNKDLFREPDGTGDWFDHGNGANSGGSRCVNRDGASGEGLYTEFDAIDVDEPLPVQVLNQISVPIKTKIVNQPFNLTILDINTSTGYLVPVTVNIKTYLGDANTLLKLPGASNIARVADFSNSSHTTADGFNYDKAVKRAKILFEYCEENGVTMNWNTCWNSNTQADLDKRRTSLSRNIFAIRPKEFYHNLTTTIPLKAGVLQSGIEFKANDYNNNPALNYNESETVSPSFVVDLNITDPAKTCAQPSMYFDPRIAFSDGTGAASAYTLHNVGDFNVTMHEIVGSEFALVDADDTAEIDRLITPFTQQIKVIPDHFTMDGNLTNGSNGFTYLSNFDGNTTVDQNISALLDANITARAFGGAATSNYTSSCYAKDGNVSLGITMLAITPSGSLSKMLWYDDINNSIQGNFPLAGPYVPLAYPALRFVSGDSNGTGNVRYRLNFDRNQTMVVNPFMMVVNEVNATDSDAVEGNQTLTTNNSAYYVYGRIIPRDIRVFGANTLFTANGWYEVYNASAINATSLPASRNDANWYTNTLHSDTISSYDGDGNVTIVNVTDVNIGGAVGNDGIEDYTFPATYSLGGYKAHINTDPWLWYGVNALGYLDPVNATNIDCMTHPCFNINIVPPVGATGSAKTKEGTSTEMDKNSKKSTSGTGWHSTTDYAPAIR